MTHELKKIIHGYLSAKSKGLKSVLATVVFLEGSSYRRPGVRMLLVENGSMVGAVSGGCVEKEILRQSASVFETGIAKVMTYDGRFRLGCEGVLYILIEPFNPGQAFINAFNDCIESRCDFNVTCHFLKNVSTSENFGTVVYFNQNKPHSVSEHFVIPENTHENILTFKQKMKPLFKLIILGAEHDAVQLCAYASLTGWEVIIVAPIADSKSIAHFPGAHRLINALVSGGDVETIDSQTAIVLMTHSFADDLKHLTALKKTTPAYIGFLGPAKRREKVLQAFLENNIDVDDDFLNAMHGPAGLNIGAETPQEIAVSIVSEILAVTRAQNPISLKNKSGGIHSNSEAR